jgi:hypothetical protein
VLCFVDAEGGRPKSFTIDDVLVTGSKDLPRRLGEPGHLSTDDIHNTAAARER